MRKKEKKEKKKKKEGAQTRGGDARREDCAAAQIWAKGGLFLILFLIKRGGIINVKEFTSIALQLKQGQTNRGQHSTAHWCNGYVIHN